jgi:hypothetical protein
MKCKADASLSPLCMAEMALPEREPISEVTRDAPGVFSMIEAITG